MAICEFGDDTGGNKMGFYCICCFSAKHAALKRKNRDGLAQNQDNVYKWDNDMSIR